jgi:hypothetical protein
VTFDEFVAMVMELSGYRRPIVHVPEAAMRLFGAVAELLPTPLFSRDAVDFLLADNRCDNAPLLAEFGIKLTPPRAGMAYLKPRG